MMHDPYQRYPTNTKALMFAADRRAPIACVICNVSEDGALLALTRPVELPRWIYLTLGKGGQVVECEVRWRKSNRQFGVRFTPNNSLDARRTLVETCAAISTSPQQRAH